MLACIVAGRLSFGIENVALALIVYIVSVVALSLLLGVIVGAVYKFLRIPTLIASIGVCLIFESLTRILFNGAGVHIELKYQVLNTHRGT